MKYLNGSGRLPLVEIDETENTRINIFDESGMIGVVEKNRGNYLLKDHLGSTRGAGEAGEKRGEFNYSDFGETTTSGDVEDIRYRYTGQEWDEEAEEYNYLAREYDPVVGRFNSPDPVRQGFSPYVYAGDNPINFVDPDGEVYILSRDRYSTEIFQVDKTIKRWDSKNKRYSNYIDPATGVKEEMSISRYEKSDKAELGRLSKELDEWEAYFSKNKDRIDDHAFDTWYEVWELTKLSLNASSFNSFVARDGSGELLSIGVLDRSVGYDLILGLRDPRALVNREIRQEGVVGNVGAQIGAEMINYSFSNGATEVTLEPISSRVRGPLEEIGFVEIL